MKRKNKETKDSGSIVVVWIDCVSCSYKNISIEIVWSTEGFIGST